MVAFVLLQIVITPLEGDPVPAESWRAETRGDGVWVMADSRAWRIEDIAEIRAGVSPATVAAQPGTVRLRTITGDVLIGTFLEPGDAEVRLRSTMFGDLSLRLDRLSSVLVWTNESSLPVNPGPNTESARDRIYYRNGDADEGSVLALLPDGVRYHSALFQRERSAAWPDLAGIYLMPLGGPPPRSASPTVHVAFRDGSEIVGALLSRDDAVVGIRDAFGTDYRAPAAEVQSVFVTGGRSVYLSDLDPVEVDENANYIRLEVSSPGDLTIPWQRDRSARETPLRLAGREYRKGIGAHARSRLVYDLGGRYERFEAVVGVDDCARPYGEVRFIVRVDGRIAYESGLQTGRDEPRQVRVDVRGARRLELIVTWGDNGGAGAYGDWAAARLVCAP